MPVLSIPAAHGWAPAPRRYGRAWETLDPADVEEMQAAIAADVAACPTCRAGGMMPSHNTGAARETSAFTYRCSSGSRWFDPTLRAMVGNSHCTCDYCW